MESKKRKKSTNVRPPVVVILGHVDHGKTTLLDKIRETNVAKKEAGGITQSVGAYIVTTKASGPEGHRHGGGKRITFIDTPGHAAFSNMRSRGANLADIAVLVVAADDGVKPQTKEALEYILQADIPFVVAATKMDLASASLETVRSQLEKEQVLFEGRGGDVPLIGVSAVKGTGIDELLEMINLVSELNKIGENEDNELEAVVIETGKDKRGPFVSALVRKGFLKVTDEVVTNKVSAKVRALFDFQGKRTDSVGAGEPCVILGFSSLPSVGETIWHLKESGQTLQKEEKRQLLGKVAEDELAIIIKAKNAGALEAISKNLPEKAVVVESSVGDVIESDIFMAKSAGADIFVFESKVDKRTQKLAETEGVKIYTFDIIYKLFEKLEEILEKGKTKILGRAKIVKVFPFNNKKVAGCELTQGVIKKSDFLVLQRNDKEIGAIKISSFRKDKEEIQQAKQGEQCGIIFTPQLEFKPGDMILSVQK
jgi:translation initiation factor IF-2